MSILAAHSAPGPSATVPPFPAWPRTGALALHRHDRPRHVAVALADGGTALLRPLRPGETAPLLEVFAGLSPGARAARYLVGLSRIPPSMLTVLTAVDGWDHVAWLGSVDGRPAGIARYLRTGPGTAEVAFEVVDEHHGRGLGSALLDAVLTTGVLHGIHRMQATVAPSNQRSLRVLRRLGLRLHDTGGLLEGEGAFRLPDPPRVDRDAVAALAPRAAVDRPPAQRAPA